LLRGGLLTWSFGLYCFRAQTVAHGQADALIFPPLFSAPAERYQKRRQKLKPNARPFEADDINEKILLLKCTIFLIQTYENIAFVLYRRLLREVFSTRTGLTLLRESDRPLSLMVF
jgi:rRNA maturation protein Nop10